MPQPGEVQTQRFVVGRFASRSAIEARYRQAGLRTFLDAPGRTGLLGPLRHRFRHGGGDPLVEDRGDDVVLGEIFLRYHPGYRLGGRELHRLVYLVGPDVQGPPEDAGEAEDVVDLVRVVAASRGDDPRLAHRDLRPYLGVGVGHGEEDRVLVHALDVLEGEDIGGGEPQEEVGPRDGLREVTGSPLGVGVLGEPPLGLVEVLATLVDDALRIAADDVFRAGGHDDLGAGHPRSADAVHDYTKVLHLLAHDLEGVDQGGQHHDGRAVLVVVEDGDIELFFQTLFDLEAPRGRDVLEIYAAEGGGQVLDGLDYRVRVLGVEAERERVDVGELLEESRFALHHGHRRPRPYVPESQDRRTVRDDGYRIALDGEVESPLGIAGYRPADAGDTRRIDHRKVVAGADLKLGADLDLTPKVHEERPV